MKIRIVLIVTILLIGGAAPASANPEPVDPQNGCSDAPLLDSGTYTGSITPKGRYLFRLPINEGESMKIRFEQGTDLEDVAIAPSLQARNEDTYDGVSVEVQEGDYRVEDGGFIGITVLESETNVATIWAEGDSPCASIHTWGTEQGGTYAFSLSQGSDEPPEILTSEEANELRNRIDDQEEIINELTERNSELESQLQEKNQRISELEAQSSDGSGSEVTIQVTVNPANGQQNFVEGGKALVQAKSENGDVGKISVEYGSGTYETDSSGQVAIPLAQTGTQEMTLVYGDTRKQVSFEVQAQEGQNEQNEQETTPTGTSGPGFGIVAALIAFLSGTFLLKRYRRS